MNSMKTTCTRRVGRLTGGPVVASVALAILAACLPVGTAGCALVVQSAERVLPLEDIVYRTMPGSSGTVYEKTKMILELLGAKITGERQTAGTFVASLQLDQQPEIIYVIVRGKDLYFRFYNLKPRKLRDKWRSRLYDEVEAALTGRQTELTKNAGR